MVVGAIEVYNDVGVVGSDVDVSVVIVVVGWVIIACVVVLV